MSRRTPGPWALRGVQIRADNGRGLAADAVTAAYGVRAALLKLRTMSERHMRMRDLAAIDAAVSTAIVRFEREHRRQLTRLPNPEPTTSADRASLRRYFRAALVRAARAEWERSG